MGHREEETAACGYISHGKVSDSRSTAVAPVTVYPKTIRRWAESDLSFLGVCGAKRLPRRMSIVGTELAKPKPANAANESDASSLSAPAHTADCR